MMARSEPVPALVNVLSALAGSQERTAVMTGVPMPSSSSLQEERESTIRAMRAVSSHPY